MKKILITGANGFLGQHLCKHFTNTACELIATGRGPSRLPADFKLKYLPIDLTEPAAVQTLKDVQADVIIHNAAMSKPDECENDKPACLAANVEATANLLALCAPHFIYVSTDFVFGENGPHQEDDDTDPLNFYGETKLRAEMMVRQQAPVNSIVRPVFIYGQSWAGMRGSFLHWVTQNLAQGKSIKVVTDQLRTPTYAPDICKGIDKIVAQTATGTYHLAGADILSPYHMAVATAKVLQLDASLVEAVTADTFPEPVKRARRSGLYIKKAVRELDYSPVSFVEGIRLSFLENCFSS